MRVCSDCGEVYPEEAGECTAHGAVLLPWAEISGLHTGVHTAVDHKIPVVDTPFEVRAVAGEIATYERTPSPSGLSVQRQRPSRTPDDSWVLGGRYQLAEQIGIGGYGAVFAARDELSGDRVAIKLLSPAASQDRELLARFYREAIAAGRAEHPHIVDLLHVGGDDDLHYIVMEYLDGCDLSKLLRASRILDPGRALAIAAQCAGGLGAAHEAGILHRDLKPANVFLVRHAARTEFVKIIDFGISKLTQHAGDYSDLTSASKVVGTPFYMAPEQARGEALDGRTDVYGLGVLLFEMLTGARPFTGQSTIEILTNHLEAPRVAPSSLRPGLVAHAGLDELVLTALAVERDERHESMAEFCEAILECLELVDPDRYHELVRDAADDDATTARHQTVLVAPPPPRRRWLWLAAGLAAIVMTVALSLSTASSGAEERPAPLGEQVAEPSASGARAQAAPAPPPVEPDAAPPDAGAPPVRTVRITSTPSRATVSDVTGLLGETPLDVDLAPDEASLELWVDAPGRIERRIVVERDGDETGSASELHVELKRRPEQQGKRPDVDPNLGIAEW